MIVLTLEIEGIDPALLQPFAVDGQEEISAQFTFDVCCIAQGGTRPSPGCIGARAKLTITPEGGNPRTIRGIVQHLAIEAPTAYGDPVVRLRLVPWMSRLALSRHNQIYGTVTEVSVADVIAAALQGSLQHGARAEDADVRDVANAIRLRSQYPKRKHITQYDETDLDFIARLAEHWGIGYFFEQDDTQDKVVFFDDPVFAPMLDDPASLPWSPLAADESPSPETIQTIEAVHTELPNTVFLQDYNELTPKVVLTASASVDPNGRGNVVLYGANFLTVEEGEFLARVRAEELRCGKIRVSGTSSVARLAPGFVFTLEGHAYPDWNTRYMLLSVKHQARIPLPGVSGLPSLDGAAADDSGGYSNSFTAMPLQTGLPFRPPRRTPWPRVAGLLNGRIEAAKPDSLEPHIDENGWYRVRLPLDYSDAPAGQASQWVRKAEPYGGPSSGMHFPLPPGTDVILACINGDPDRLVIVGAVPSADNPSVVTNPTGNLNRIRTRSGISVTFADVLPRT